MKCITDHGDTRGPGSDLASGILGGGSASKSNTDPSFNTTGSEFCSASFGVPPPSSLLSWGTAVAPLVAAAAEAAAAAAAAAAARLPLAPPRRLRRTLVGPGASASPPLSCRPAAGAGCVAFGDVVTLPSSTAALEDPGQLSETRGAPPSLSWASLELGSITTGGSTAPEDVVIDCPDGAIQVSSSCPRNASAASGAQSASTTSAWMPDRALDDAATPRA
mmetsp:Transcript_70065/g.194735  ORF Transcript_70065/g.194735 Transcript_70065/m.194735 type:complete len:220 (+) Transcript_70065:1338-1997(+)